jgi:hypothetical protein
VFNYIKDLNTKIIVSEKFDNTKGVIRSHNFKLNRQDNGQKKTKRPTMINKIINK